MDYANLKRQEPCIQRAPLLHVRGTLLYNFYIAKNKLEYKYPLVQEGEKIKYMYLATKQNSNENVISFLNTFPSELEWKEYRS